MTLLARLRSKFAGSYSLWKLYHLAEAATVVMPSMAGEVFGMVAAENMARGKLIILSDVGSLREVIGDTGL
jgi:glycosyltransferase involved in cell wall biosynthesis